MGCVIGVVVWGVFFYDWDKTKDPPFQDVRRAIPCSSYRVCANKWVVATVDEREVWCIVDSSPATGFPDRSQETV